MYAVLATLAVHIFGAPATIPAVVGSFCDTNYDFQVEAGKTGGTFNYSICMDVAAGSWAMVCTKGVPCPQGETAAHSVFVNSTIYVVDYDGKCTSKADPAGNPPNAIPFSMLLIDSGNRGNAVKIGKTTIDGIVVDHWQHNRTAVNPAYGVMSWYLKAMDNTGSTGAMIRTTYADPSGTVGNRDFSRGWATPAKAGSFAIPAACTSVSSLAPSPSFGDAW